MTVTNLTITSVNANQSSGQILDKLKRAIEMELELPVNVKRADADQDAMSGEWIIALEIIGVTISAVTLFVSILHFHIDSKRNYSLNYKVNDIDVVESGLSEKEFESRLRKLQQDQVEEAIIILEGNP